ncbi:alkyl sulfatase dimerization domain-containing protein [Nocardia sp. NPDC050712]|uniref:alkyl/aryl-sulfatase n=1 Tax=Nocardia sp. NPDC050712 TaxID=3155518 RepID=UPI0033CB1279
MCQQPKPASSATARVNQEATQRYDMADRTDFTDAQRGLIAPLPGPVYADADTSKVVFDPADFDYLRGDPPTPDSVNPSLWRQSQLIGMGGLYEVTKGVYQARNNDIANLTVVEGEDGIIVIDCMAGVESARQGMALVREHVTDKPVRAVIYTHTHVDHYGGVKGVVSAEEVASGKVPIIAPGRQFDKFALGENVIAGNAMARRSFYAFGSMLPSGPQGFVSCGIGLVATRGPQVSYMSPTDLITETGARREIAGIEFEFLYAPDTEAPEEMHIWIPQLKALTCAENANHSLHNIQTLRGARTRDARNFARYLDETLERWGAEAEVHYGPHTWPVWGNDNVTAFLESQRDTYKYIHDQALRLANKGYTPLEAAEVIELPDELGRTWANRGYHGTLHHDVRAVYTKELGMWDGDPVSLHPHPPAEAAARFVEFAGADSILAEGRRAFDAGDYRWAAQILHGLVFAQPDNQQARDLQADAYEQMGYQAEGPQWRGIFLSAALELRAGVQPPPYVTASQDSILAMPIEILFDFVSVHVIGEQAATADLRIDLDFTDVGEQWHLWVRRGVLNARRGKSGRPQLSVTGPKPYLVSVLLQPGTAAELAQSGKIALDGDAATLDRYALLLDEFDPAFPIVTP